jgi:hypothetical protein
MTPPLRVMPMQATVPMGTKQNIWLNEAAAVRLRGNP